MYHVNRGRLKIGVFNVMFDVILCKMVLLVKINVFSLSFFEHFVLTLLRTLNFYALCAIFSDGIYRPLIANIRVSNQECCVK